MLINAVLCVWNEQDIIESTIRHAFAQGCSNVYIIDNASTDNTADIAVKAGATIARRFESKYFDVFEKTAYLNTVVRDYSESSDTRQIWWLYIDADEFPQVKYGGTIAGFLQALDPAIRAVHGHMFNHHPSHPPYHVSPYHPIDFMQAAVKTEVMKVPLLRYDKGKPHLYSAGGAHTLDTCGESLDVAFDALQIHHFTHRKPEDTITRLNALCRTRDDGTTRVDTDYKDSEIFQKRRLGYIARQKNAARIYADNKYISLLTDDIPYDYASVTRWYDRDEITLPGCPEEEELLGKALRHFYSKQYDAALLAFNKLLELQTDVSLHMLVMIKVAQCLSVTDKDESLSLLAPIRSCKDKSISEYATQQYQKIADGKPPLSDKTPEKYITVQSYYGNYERQDFIPPDEQDGAQRAKP